ncbi:MAG: RecQ family ATP-dependent DNA helicase [Candidatus Thorarchaeota archaeon]
MNYQLYAGYTLNSISKALLSSDDSRYWSDLLRNLCVFDVEFDNLNVSNNDPVCIVADNLISRGIPTIPPLFVEEYISEAFNFASKKESLKTGEIFFSLTKKGKELLDNIKNAFHIVDPRIDESNTDVFDFDTWEKHPGSDCEENFYKQTLPTRFGKHSIQLIESQRSIKSILNYSLAKKRRVDSYLGDFISDFYNQRIDFSFQFPQLKNYNAGLVIEIDGSQHDSDGQKYLDEMRDKAIERNGWLKPVRIRTDEIHDIPESKIDIITKFFNHPYAETIKKNYENPLWLSEDGLNILQITLTPIGIARIQKVFTSLILSGTLKLSNKKWKIAVIERDVPCANLALLDFKELFYNLFRLEHKKRKLPEIELRVYNTTEFSQCKLNENFKCELYSESIKEFDADVLIDISVLQRKGYTTPSGEFVKKIKAANTVTVRSSHFASSERRMLSGFPIKYNVSSDIFSDALQYFLQNIFRKTNFLEGQLKILERTLSQKNVIALLPTGGGKSLTYQISALLQPGIALIVDPLKSLMHDQNDNLQIAGIDSTIFINSTLNPEEREDRSERMTRGFYKFIFVSPERLLIEEFRKKLRLMPERETFVCYCVVDEAHCVSEWGHDFRTSYLKLGESARKYCPRYDRSTVPLMALTGTASFDVLSDVQRELEIEDDKAIISPEKYARDELKFKIQDVGVAEVEKENHFTLMKAVAELKQVHLNRLLKEIPSNDWGNQKQYNSVKEFYDTENAYPNAGIVFCPHVSEKSGFGVLSVSPLVQESINALQGLTGIYAGSIEDENADLILEETQRKFKNNELALLVATKAFGMGIDKANLRFTIHYNMPQSIESFYQEAGRAGRDRDYAYCYILYSTTMENDSTLDKNLMMSFHQNSFPGIEKEERVVVDLLEEIKFPYTKRVDEISESVSNELEKERRLNLWQKRGNRLYVNTLTYPESYGYIDLNSKRVYAEKRETHRISSDESSIKTLQKIFSIVLKLQPEDKDLIQWIEQVEKRAPEPGIENLLSTMRQGESKRLTIGFTNDAIQRIAEYLSDKDEAWTEDIVEKAYEFCNDDDEYVQRLISIFKDKTKKFKRIKNEDIINNADSKFIKDHFYKIRSQKDTFKAVYRLSILGVIDDYNIDYRGKLINVRITKKTDNDYLTNLHKYISRYESREEAANIFTQVEDIDKKTTLRKCINYLIDFVYRFIAAKRKEAIDVMDSVINEGLKDNQAFTEAVNSYFDSKYTTGLRKDISDKLDILTVWKYIGKTKGERDSIIHLRGSCDRLLVETPDNPILLLLRSFCRFLLTAADKSAAIRDYKVGWQRLKDLKSWKRIEYLDNLSKYYDLCVGYDKTTIQYLDPLIAEIHIDWLKMFNKKFAEGVPNG